MASSVKLAPLPQIEKLSERVVRILGCNARPMTLQGTNSYLIGKGDRRILLDTTDPGTPDYIKNLQNALSQHKCGIQEIIITHWHADHCGSVQDVCNQVTKSQETIVSKFQRLSQQDLDISPAKYTFVENNTVFKTEGATLRAIHTPGHTEEHMALYLEEENAVFSGDTVLGETTAVFEDLQTYMGSLSKILELNPSVIYPSHGSVINDPTDKLKEYIAHRMNREQQILHCMKELNRPMTAEELVEKIYTDLNPMLKMAAANNVVHHLEKLVKDGFAEKIEEEDTRWILKKTGNL
ncbi:endoribonuclease LACTB2-like [Mytilus trossulus]|uniref:endoribonuclease LACTB2-like n=1 Tax=Mytilus trossulus TaxID=6551 RepID=UPI003004796A